MALHFHRGFPSDLCNIYSKLDFSNFFIKKYLLLFFTNLKLLMFQSKSVEISESLNKCSLLKIYIQTTYPIDFLHSLQPFLRGVCKNIWYTSIPWYFFEMVCTTVHLPVPRYSDDSIISQSIVENHNSPKYLKQLKLKQL